MIHCLIRYLSGYVKIQIKGYSPERFLNLCCYHRIRFWGLTRIGTNYELYLSLSDFRKIRPYVRKTHTKVILKKRYGFPFFLYRYRKRKIFFIASSICTDKVLKTLPKKQDFTKSCFFFSTSFRMKKNLLI